jgi:putative sterol carrier protein
LSLDRVIDSLRQRAERSASLGYRVRFDLGGDGSVIWDGTVAPAKIVPGEGDADTTIGITLDNLNGLLTGDLDPTLAYATGKIKVSGSVGVALKLASILEG